MKISLSLILFLLPLRSFSLEYYTGDLAPWAISSTQGIFVELVREIEKRRKKINPNIKVLPWARAQLDTQDNDDIIIFPLTRTPRREKQYTWIVKVMPVEMGFITYKNEPPHSIEEGKKLNSVIAHSDSPPYHFLMKHKFKNVRALYRGSASVLRLLESRRFDAWFSSKNHAAYLFKEEFAKKHVKFGSPVYKGWLHIAASKSLSDKVVNDYRRIYKELEKEGFVQKLIDKYLKYQSN